MEMPAAEELIRRIQELEEAHSNLGDDMSKLAVSGVHVSENAAIAAVATGRSSRLPPKGDDRRRYGGVGASGKVDFSASWKLVPPLMEFRPGGAGGDGSQLGLSAFRLTDRQYLNILQSMGQAIHIINGNYEIIYWNRPAEILYGYSAVEALGKTVFELIVDIGYEELGSVILSRVKGGECWTGLFPVRSKLGRRFSIAVTDTPLYDEDGTFVGTICVAGDSKEFEDVRSPMPETLNSDISVNFSQARSSVSTKPGLDPEQPLQVAIASKITGLATKVSNKVRVKMKSGKDVGHGAGWRESFRRSGDRSSDVTPFHNMNDASSYEASLSGIADLSPFGGVSQADEFPPKFGEEKGEKSERRTAIHKITSKAEAWISNKAVRWSCKRNEEEFSGGGCRKFGWSWLQGDQDNDHSSPAQSELKTGECNNLIAAEIPGSSSFWVNVGSSRSTSSSCKSTSSSSAKILDVETGCYDYEVYREDLTFKERIGQGSVGTVYHGLWCGSDVAIKVFSGVEYTEDAILSFRQEVSLMKALRHPNILLFMGAVTSPPNLCIITEFLPRGSLFRLLQRSAGKLDWKRKIHMAVDIARGMNYLHHCNPPIVHRDLKSSNLLVDRNWNVKVADFGLSRIKHETYLTTKTGRGTPQWMAPEVLRHEPSDEKCDVYSFGVVLWELVTEKIPWDDLNSMQVIGAVGFMSQTLEIPTDIDPRWAAIIRRCWHSEPRERPSFQDLLKTFKDLAKKHAVQSQAAKPDPLDDL